MRRTRAWATLGAYAALASVGAAAAEDRIQLIDAPGRELTAESCGSCHSLDYIQMNAPLMNRGSWEKSVHKMIDKFGAPIRPEDVEQIIAYLAANYAG
jgi:mono/diheme cytochrome c family protein